MHSHHARHRVARRSAFGAALLSIALLAAACGSGTDTATAPEAGENAPAAAINVVSPEEAKAIIDSDPEGLVVLDVRTQEEYDEAHLANAVLIDFYAPDFAAQIAELDPTVPYVVYCRSGSRSGQATDIMADLEFQEINDVSGGITAWIDAGLPTQ